MYASEWLPPWVLTGSSPPTRDPPVLDERAALAGRAEAVGLERHDDERREVVVDHRRVDVVGPDAGAAVHVRAAVCVDSAPREVVAEHDARRAACRSPARRPGSTRAGGAGSRARSARVTITAQRAVALDAAVEQAQRVGDHPRGLVVLERDRLAHHRARVARRMARAVSRRRRRTARSSCRTRSCADERTDRTACAGVSIPQGIWKAARSR